MMGRLSCTEEPEPRTRTVFPADPFMNSAKNNIPQHHKEVSFPSIPSNDIRSQSSQLHRNHFAEKPPDRAQSAFQESSYRVPEARDIQRTATVTPNLKLPPIHPHSSAPQEAVMPPHADVPLQGDRYPAYPDLSAAYDNMMVGYFMSPNAKVDTYLPYKQQDIQLSTEGFHSSGQQICHSNYVFPPTASNQLLQEDPMLNPLSPSQISMQKGQNFRIQNAPASQAGRKSQLQRSKNSIPGDNHPPLNRHTAMDITSSGCTVLDASAFHPDHKHAAFGDVPKPDHPPKPLAGDPQQPSTYADLSTVLDDISLFITPQHTPVMRPESDHRTFSAMAGTTYSNHQYQPKTDPTFGRYSVLPPVMSSATPGGGDGDNLSMLSYASVPAQSTYCAPFFAAADSSSPRFSGRSSYSGRSVRNGKRALSNSPLDGIDLNALIRMSPTSLVAYINGSRSSSSSSPGGCYGHLSARTSPGSGSSGGHHRRGSAAFDLDDNLLVIQAMRDIEASAADVPELPPEFDNLQVMRQDLAAGDFPLPPVAHCKPPPTYDQHMARKAVLQKNGSSDSSQPSNSSSFESSEGDKTVGSSGTDTEGATRMYACRWLDCTAVFQDQDEFVTHIEKLHIDQKKGEDFICFWKLCPRRLHPFNARYKLLVHMRIHSGDKPNKCTFAGCQKAFSRLENLKIHLRSHTGERPYSCVHPGCNKTFSNSSDRTKHQKTHNDTKPYVCQIVGCGKRYTDPSSLRKHIKKSHPEKKEPDRKKIRGGAEELDPNDLSECLVIQAIKPITLCDTSPPEPTDSGLGRSPRSSQPSSSSDHYPGLVYSGETFPGSVHNNCHTSPSSHNSSPRAQNDSDIISLNNNLRVPILPLLIPQNKNYSQAQKTPTFRNSSVF